MNSTMKKTLIASSVAMALGAPSAYAVGVNDLYGNASFTTDSANFTMLGGLGNGGVVGGTNNVVMTWDGDGFNASSDYTGPGSYANVTASSTAPFFGHSWTAHDIQVFTPGTYSFDTTIGGGNGESGMLTGTVGTGQLGMHMLFDWNGNYNIDVFVVASPGVMFGSGLVYSTQTNTKGQFKCDTAFTGTIIQNCLFDGGPYGSAGAPTTSQVWMLASTDANGDGIMGIPMALGGPFPGFNANFNANLNQIADISDIPTAVPVPAAVWLFGSGLLGLVGIARRKKKV
jgi:hypothetical protein